MINKINQLLSKIDVTIKVNNVDSQFSDFILCHKKKIIGHGWKRDDVNEIVGFMGLELRAIHGKLCWTKSKITNEEFENYLKLFQFAVSENYFWYSKPTCASAGYYCESVVDFGGLINDINIFINCNYDIKLFYNSILGN